MFSLALGFLWFGHSYGHSQFAADPGTGKVFGAVHAKTVNHRGKEFFTLKQMGRQCNSVKNRSAVYVSFKLS